MNLNNKSVDYLILKVTLASISTAEIRSFISFQYKIKTKQTNIHFK